MTEVEYSRILDAVSGAVATPRRAIPLADTAFRNAPPAAANDNDDSNWPLIPFPQGWSGSC